MRASIRRSPRASLMALLPVLSGVAGVASASTASASTQASSVVKVSAVPSRATPYCSAELTPRSNVVKNARCYSTHSGMMAALPAVTIVISIDYMNANYGGASYTWTTTATCTYFPEYWVLQRKSSLGGRRLQGGARELRPTLQLRRRCHERPNVIGGLGQLAARLARCASGLDLAGRAVSRHRRGPGSPRSRDAPKRRSATCRHLPGLARLVLSMR
jgi:hypothetical protein